MKAGIVGIGVVGGATMEVFSRVHEIFPYDKYKSGYNSEQHIRDLALNPKIIFLCVPTPMKPSGEIDYSPINNSLSFLVNEVQKYGRNPGEVLIVLRSTAVSGTTDNLAKKYPFRFSFNPEFLTEKNALKDMENTDKVVIGANNSQDYQLIHDFYSALFPDAKYIHVNTKTAEMIKYCANVMLAGQVSLANELYQICQATGVDYNTVKGIISLDPRIGKHIDVPGHDGELGFGGKCFPKDLNALIYLSRENMYRPYLLEEIWRLNEKIRKNKDWLDISGAVSGNNNSRKD